MGLFLFYKPPSDEGGAERSEAEGEKMKEIKYPALDIKKYSGEEKIISQNGKQISTLKEFWSWAYSDILGNAERGAIAEFIVACALNLTDRPRITWDKYDLLLKENGNEIAIEVKSSGYFQTWGQREKSKLIFGIQPTKAWDYVTDEFEEEQKRQADIYVFCVHNVKEKNDKMNTLDLSQWDFYLLPTSVINEKLGNQKTVSLDKLVKIGAESCPYEKLRERIIDLVFKK